MTPKQFVAATGATEKWASVVIAAMKAFGTDTPLRQAHFLAQAGHESAGFKTLVENLNYSAEGLRATWPTRFTPERAAAMARKPELIANHVYGNRLGNTKQGDGWRFRGRGIFQLTGRENYARAGKALDMPFEAEPERLESPEAAAMTAAWFWKDRGLNALADADDLLAVTRRINGGLHGLEDRRLRLVRAKKALGI